MANVYRYIKIISNISEKYKQIMYTYLKYINNQAIIQAHTRSKVIKTSSIIILAIVNSNA